MKTVIITVKNKQKLCLKTIQSLIFSNFNYFFKKTINYKKENDNITYFYYK